MDRGDELSMPWKQVSDFEQILIYLNKCSLVCGAYQFITSQGSGYTSLSFPFMGCMSAGMWWLGSLTKNSHVKAVTLDTSNVAIFGDEVFKK